MVQQTKPIDVTRSYFVAYPNSIFNNLRYPFREDVPEKTPPIIAYEGHNFIPTSYGYRSYFGLNYKLDIDSLGSNCDDLFLFQLADYQNIIIALCDDGLWYTASTTLTGALWTQGISLTVPPSGEHKEWTYCIIENTLYLYREGEPHYWKMRAIDFTVVPSPLGVSLTLTPVVPTFLTMSGQKGIFRANASLGFWDSLNSISWSSPLDLQDFVPSLTTLAGNATFSGILGSITTIRSQGDNFVVYTSKGIVGIRFVPSSALIWEATTISDTAGVSSPKNVTTAITEMEHYAYTNTGFKKVGNYNALNKVHLFEEIITEVYDLFQENNPEISMSFLNGRYLFISLTDDKYIDGIISNELDTVSDILAEAVPGAIYDYTYPGSTFLFQDGVLPDIYPTYVGALVFDTALKKWGKFKGSYKALLDHNVFNSVDNQVLPYSHLGVDASTLNSSGDIYAFDAKPSSSFMKYGKIGYTRKGFTVMHEVRMHFRLGFTGTVILDTSLNGTTIESSLTKSYAFTNVLNANCFPVVSGKWHTIKIAGNFDLQYLEFRGIISGRR